MITLTANDSRGADQVAIHRALARKALRLLGLERIRHPSFVDLMKREGIDTVLDVGANEGQFASDIRALGYQGRIHSFEPVPAVYDVLRQRARRDELWEAHQLGLGDVAGELPMQISEASVCSSFRAPSAYFADRFSGARTTRQQAVPVERLDAFLTARDIDLGRTYLKVDTQGFEKQVLLGAGDRLRDIRVVQLELAIRPLYEEQDTLMPMLSWMLDRGFEIAMVKEGGFDWRHTRLYELDVAFVRA